MTEQIINLYKPLGMTPLQALKALKLAYTGRFDLPMTYAGRLDPMAEGVLILLSGDAIQNKQKYLDLEKTYTAEILFGFKTDSLDMLGLAETKASQPSQTIALKEVLQKLRGDIQLSLPVFSSVPFRGKPLFAWARERLLDLSEIPKRKTMIYSIKLLEEKTVTGKEILETTLEKISKVEGDFRQNAIQKRWMELLIPVAMQDFKIAKIEVSCSSGTYIRALANKIGEEMNTSAVLYSLRRDAVGSFTAKDSLRLF